MLDWLRLWPEFLRLNLQKARHRRRLRRAPAGVAPPAPCQSASDSGRAGITRCEACHCVRRATRYRLVCPALEVRGSEGLCTLNAAEVRPLWGRAAAGLMLPPASVLVLLGLAIWAVLQAQGLRSLDPLSVLWPPRWSEIAEARRHHFQSLAVEAFAAGDPASATIALFSAAQTGHGTQEENQRLARLATLGGYHSITDAIHTADLARHPARADAIATAWHDDLLIGDRPGELARLALARLASPDSPRGVWLAAFLESIRHPGVAAPLLADSELTLPHPGLRHALAARADLDAGRPARAGDQLIALAGLRPGPEVRRFLTLGWLSVGDARRALAAALDPSHPAAPGEPALLAYAVLARSGDTDQARAALRPLLADPRHRLAVLSALIETPDAVLVAELHAAAPPAADTGHRELSARWLAARRAAAPELAATYATTLALAGRAIPAELLGADLASASRQPRGLAVAILSLDREILYALRAPELPRSLQALGVMPISALKTREK
ncbi:MAG: hypothetical protein MUE42_08665 [Opitutaceae bacterium]|nr:hypothetical protein [Opitutaceae bacterium]